ncbi:MAG: hypothetical protein ACPKPY_10670 [Nitrososphaeraceae archaeon]
MNSNKNSKYVLPMISIGALVLVGLLSAPQINLVLAKEKDDGDSILYISTIRELLNQSMIEFNVENYTGASELVDIAYIDNYEFIEDPLEELDKELMEETEIMIREDYADAIEDKESEKASILLDQILINLDKAEAKFLEEP